ncbi:glutaminase A [Chengkuizengella sp. 2205SS18-9]|uniref:Glutaminase n=2 Tax=Chengkuizengella axinellae TaxID=3064388 RepID=A0ABT9J144_9BACL|nr:glutaminase A [Chengkuizengella sp. 2205SS18-9]MDP5275335.1 glutaminase A [Chengkuizengella sp. 2205SS18-9]
MDYSILEPLIRESRNQCNEGKVASYIPELSKVSGDLLGITVHEVGKDPVTAGECMPKFTLQSISKVFALLLALIDRGEQQVFEKVGMEPTGDMYNSLMKLEIVTPGKPFNPMINAGAITVTSFIEGDNVNERFERILSFIQKLSGDDSIYYNEKVYHSENHTAHRNRALAHLLKDNGILEGDVEEHLEVYFKQCAIETSCTNLARMGMILANGGKDPETSEQLIPKRYVQIAKTFMITCGMYNASGEFAIEAGIPAKSGVSGGILAVAPNMGIGVIGPALDRKGNSIAGIRLLTRLSEEWDLTIF